MMNVRFHSVIFRFGLIMFGMLVFLIGFGPMPLNAQDDCAISLQEGDSIQEAVNDTDSGAVICIGPGDFAENLSVFDSKTIRGAGRDEAGNWRTSISGVRLGTQTINVFNQGGQIDFVIEDIEVLNSPRFSEDQMCASDDQSQCPDGLILDGNITARISNVRLSGHGDDALSILGATVLFEDSVVENSGDTGILILGFTQFGASSVEMNNIDSSRNNVDGLLLLGPGELSIQNSTFSENGDDGVSIIGSFNQQAEISNNTISGNGGDGFFFQDEVDSLIIENNVISGSGSCAIRTIGATGAQGSGNQMESNRGAVMCGDIDHSLRVPLAAQSTELEISYPGTFDSLQAAVDVVAPGGRINLAEGSFSESVTLWKPVQIVGSGSVDSLIDGMITLTGDAQDVELRGFGISNSPIDGLLLHGTSSAEADGVVIASNNTHGVSLWESASLTLRNSEVSNNGVNAGCGQSCHGIFLNDATQISLNNVQIENNNGWGLTSRLQRCGFSENLFTGSVELINVFAADNGLGDICTP